MAKEAFGPNQDKVFNEALKRLEKEPWFKGVCCDDFPSEVACEEDFEGCVSSITFNTAMWDDPDFYSF